MATFEVSPVKKESQPLIKKVDYEAAFWGELNQKATTNPCMECLCRLIIFMP